eukprot:TRINITY_DN6984_c0_g1_i12.p1 TRINITY_DN6984_c0_g1~~TRINITY_DN6984_c0_g1_i12.p1  ORF type:complete len:234 (-),score=-29.01 TRINITY_DN6984_c0_g1_i12:262-963(-)
MQLQQYFQKYCQKCCKLCCIQLMFLVFCKNRSKFVKLSYELHISEFQLKAFRITLVRFKHCLSLHLKNFQLYAIIFIMVKYFQVIIQNQTAFIQTLHNSLYLFSYFSLIVFIIQQQHRVWLGYFYINYIFQIFVNCLLLSILLCEYFIACTLLREGEIVGRFLKESLKVQIVTVSQFTNTIFFLFKWPPPRVSAHGPLHGYFYIFFPFSPCKRPWTIKRDFYFQFLRLCQFIE